LKFKIIGRSGYGDFYPAFLIAEEEVVFIIEAEDLKDLENKLEGVIILKIEGEDCILIPESSIPKLMEFIDNPERFWKWWSLGDWVEVGNKKGKLFIVK
jgi:hypothetical protein